MFLTLAASRMVPLTIADSVKFVDFTLNKHYHMLPEYLSYFVLRFRVFFPCIKHKT